MKRIIGNITNFFQKIFSKDSEIEVLPSKDYSIDDFGEDVWNVYFRGIFLRDFGSKKNAIKHCWNHDSTYSLKKENNFSLFDNHKIIDVSVV